MLPKSPNIFYNICCLFWRIQGTIKDSFCDNFSSVVPLLCAVNRLIFHSQGSFIGKRRYILSLQVSRNTHIYQLLKELVECIKLKIILLVNL